MRKALLLITLLLIAGGAIGYFLFRLTRKPAPTPVGWRARVTTFAGDGSPLFRDSQQATQAAFSDPFGIAVANDGTVYVADGGESNRIRKITPDATVTTLAGGSEGFGDGVGTAASFHTPSGLALDADGNLLVADTGNNRIRRITPEGEVSTVAGDGTAGFADGPVAQAKFNGPIGVAVDKAGNIVVADTYNDRIRVIAKGEVTSVVGKATKDYATGTVQFDKDLFDTPCGIVARPDGSLIVADSGNNRLRKITPEGQVTDLPVNFPNDYLSNPAGLAISHDNFLYVTELNRSRVIQIAPDDTARVITGDSADGSQLNQLRGIAINPDTNGQPELYVADSGNYVVRKLDQTDSPSEVTIIDGLPQLTNETLGQQSLLWPLDPQDQPHEVVATLGEVRGSFDSTDSRHHLHSGLDVFGAYGSVVRAVRSEKVTNPLPNWGFDSLNEGMRVGVISYIHIHVGRDKDAKMFDDPRFIPVKDDEQKLVGVRIKRGTRFRPGDAVGTINQMYHVHMNVGSPGAEINPLTLSPIGFKDDVSPQIEKNGIQLFDQSGAQFSQKQNGRLLVTGRVRIVVDAFDRTNMNANRRRLGLYLLGYQILKSDGTPAKDFDQPRITQIFDRLPPDRESTKIAYADQSGITVYGSETTRFLYEVTNWVRDGRANTDTWDTSKVPPGDYVLRIIARDYNGNEAQEGRDLLITIR